MEPDPVVRELDEAIAADTQLLMSLSEDLRQLMELAREVLGRHHELLMAWMGEAAEVDEENRSRPGFTPRIVGK